MFTLRFDMRTPAEGAPTPELYAAAVQMCEWAETRGAVVVLSEHHGTEDGHLPAPHRIPPREETVAYVRCGRPLRLLPLCGGLLPKLAWPYLERAASVSASSAATEES
ncbi:hypothetical protein A5650_07625 [Mycobacterium sp. 1164985.4]|nr:hypothetical protein A5650_13090 [Mycobacterium sp. 1164985.4]OBK79623.1 hypothetical protein A5650_07625 [Mycobacterium sp. 1164985.4]